MELAPAAPLAGDGKIGHQGDADDDQGEQSLGEHGKRHQGIYGIPTPARVGTVKAQTSAIECSGDEQAENRLRDEHASKKEISHAGGSEESGVESGAVPKARLSPNHAEQNQQKHGERRLAGARQIHSRRRYAKDPATSQYISGAFSR